MVASRRTSVGGPARLDDDRLRAWFAARGWTTTTDLRHSYAFADEAHLLSTVIRRLWHTALSVERATSPGTDALLLLLQVEGTSEVELSDATTYAVGEGMALLVRRSELRRLACPDASARIEVEMPIPTTTRAGRRETPRCGRAAEAVAWFALVAMINAHLNLGPRAAAAASGAELQAAIAHLVAAIAADLVATEGDAPERDDGGLFARAMRLIDEEATDAELTVETLARRLGVSPRHLSRVFTPHSLSPRDALAHRRVLSALLLRAREPHLTQAELARAVGFPSAGSLRHRLGRHESG